MVVGSGEGNHSRMKDGPGETLQLAAFEKMTLPTLPAGQTWSCVYGCLCICWFIRPNFTARCCRFCTAPRALRQTDSAASFCSRRWVSNQHTRIQTVKQGRSLFHGQCQVTMSAHCIARERITFFLLHHVFWLLATSFSLIALCAIGLTLWRGEGGTQRSQRPGRGGDSQEYAWLWVWLAD